MAATAKVGTAYAEYRFDLRGFRQDKAEILKALKKIQRAGSSIPPLKLPAPQTAPLKQYGDAAARAAEQNLKLAQAEARLAADRQRSALLAQRVATETARTEAAAARAAAANQRLAQSQTQSVNSALRLAQEQAKLASAQGDHARAAQILQAALAGVDSSSLQAVRAQQHLAQINKRMAAESAASTKALGGLAGAAAQLGAALGAIGFAAGISALGAFAFNALRGAVASAAEFEQAIANVGAVSNATAEDMARLEAAAKQAGATTKFTATQAADGLAFLAMAGFSTNESIAALPGVLSLAAAANVDLGLAADIASNILSGFNLQADETGRVVDVLAKAAASSNTSVPQLGNAMKYVAPVAAQLGLSLEETAAAIGKLSDAGIQGESAGTALRGILTRLAAPTGEAAALITDLGIALFDTQGRMKDLPALIDELANATANLTDAERIAVFKKLVGEEATAALGVLISQRDGLRELAGTLEDAGGAAEQMAARQLDTLNGQLTLLQSALDAAAVSVGQALTPALKDLVSNALIPAAEGAGVLADAFNQAMTRMRESGTQPLDPMAQLRNLATELGNALGDQLFADNIFAALSADAQSAVQAQLDLGASMQEALAVGQAYQQTLDSITLATALAGTSGDIAAEGLGVLSSTMIDLAGQSEGNRLVIEALAEAYIQGQLSADELAFAVDNMTIAKEAAEQAALNEALAEQRLAEARSQGTDATNNQISALYEEIAAKLIAEAESAKLAHANQELQAAAQAAAQGSGSIEAAASALAAQFQITELQARQLIGALREVAALGGISQKGGVGYTPATKEQLAAMRDYRAEQERALRLATRAAAGGGGSGSSGGRGKSEAQRAAEREAKEQERLAKQQETERARQLERLEKLQRSHEEKILGIQEEFARKQREQEQKNNLSKLQSRASFYDALTKAEAGGDISAEQAQQLAGAYEAAFAESQRLAQEGKAALAAEYLALRQSQIEEELAYEQALAEAKAKGNQAEVERLQAIEQLKRAAREEELKQLLEGGDKNINDRDQALAEADEDYIARQAEILGVTEEVAAARIAGEERSAEAVQAGNDLLRDRVALLRDVADASVGRNLPVPPTEVSAPSATTGTSAPAAPGSPEGAVLTVADSATHLALADLKATLARVSAQIEQLAGPMNDTARNTGDTASAVQSLSRSPLN